MTATDPTKSSAAAPTPQFDFSVYGEVETVPLTRLQILAGAALTRNSVAIPHVTHHDDADITELEALRRRLAEDDSAVKITPLIFLIKGVAAVLKAYPRFNASLDPSGKQLILKKYINIGIAIDTPNGLLVGVVRDCDRKGWRELAAEVATLSAKAREKGLPLAEMSGGCFTISSLGGLGGTGFTPIINAPEVAILGVGRNRPVPRPDETGGIDWRTMLPLSLSYDHRVINGADAARFTSHLAALLADPATLIDV
ncbi:2-oxo acid dehydrogenase subunit E2 [Azospirillum sp. B510]|uniref:2-oxo acid dehydrogenase subunit E2 n=1 Tax=Azospirillum sp. (strain B510) TaxID=137722 RepID=UPI0011D04E95|nr:2-oxo acid dehydrogenase subunit E2 [Azospirillum sp. B510]